ncbi:MAG: DNA repair protein RecN [Clostridia bacterium]|nr:DNA repair protein RecN [Clostridia bacterium]
MLRRLEIKNFAVISHCIFEPNKGLNVISGETGAGKSLLIDAIGLILGDKASKTLIRTNADKAFVEAVFDYELISDGIVNSVKSILDESGIEFDDSCLIVTREISADGKSVARINGRTVVLSVLKSVTSQLIDIHGQNDTQQIFDDTTHVKLLDGFIGSDVEEALKDYKLALSQYRDIVVKIKKLGSSPEQRKMRREFLVHATEEIRKANFKENEEEALHELKTRLSNTAKVSAIFEQVEELIGASEQSGNSKVKIASGLLSKLANVSDDYASLAQRLESLSLELDALSTEITNEFNELDNADQKLDEVNERISLLFDLKSKYGNTIAEINEYASNAENEINEIDNTADVLAALKGERLKVEADLLNKAKNLSEVRHAHAEELSKKIISELVDLEMPSSQFAVAFNEHSKEKFFSANGTEDISFSFSANPGEALKPLSKIVSGGEASRIMLAIKTILSEVDDTSTLVFDEIDTGISGVASLQVANKLRTISRNHQVLSVSHTAQIAAAADNNFFIHKEISDNSSATNILQLDKEGKINEVSRLLSGTNNSESLDLAKSLINQFG